MHDDKSVEFLFKRALQTLNSSVYLEDKLSSWRARARARFAALYSSRCRQKFLVAEEALVINFKVG